MVDEWQPPILPAGAGNVTVLDMVQRKQLWVDDSGTLCALALDGVTAGLGYISQDMAAACRNMSVVDTLFMVARMAHTVHVGVHLLLCSSRTRNDDHNRC
jgi:hypothetical protein